MGVSRGVASCPGFLGQKLGNYVYPNIKALITVLCTLPVTSCSAERSFSGLKRIKSVLRSGMTNELLSGLALLHVHQDIPIDVEEVIDEFSRRHPIWWPWSAISIRTLSARLEPMSSIPKFDCNQLDSQARLQPTSSISKLDCNQLDSQVLLQPA